MLPPKDMIERVGKSYDVWYEAIRNNEQKDRSLKYLESFLGWRGWDYEDFYTRYLEATRSHDPRDLALMNTNIVNYFEKLTGDGYATGSAKNYVGVIVGFLAENGLPVAFNKQQRKRMKRRTIHEKGNWSKEEIREAVAATTNPRNKALAYCAKDNGMAVSDLADLVVEDLKGALDGGDKFAQVEYVRNKTGELGWPCFGYESLDALRVWMRWRKANRFNCEPESPLFILTEKPDGPGDYRRDELLAGIKMGAKTMSQAVAKMVERAGLSGRGLSAHSFRIFNSSSLESAGVNKNIVYRIQARTIPDSGKTYSKGEVLSSYVKAYPSLVVGPTPQIIEIPDPRSAELEARLMEVTANLNRRIEEEVKERKEADAVNRSSQVYRALTRDGADPGTTFIRAPPSPIFIRITLARRGSSLTRRVGGCSGATISHSVWIRG